MDDDGEETGEFYAERLTPAPHHELIIDNLEAVERGEIRRLMIFMGPGTAKSTYASVAFPTWYMGRKRNRAIGAISYGDVLCRQFGAKCRAVASSEQYGLIFNAKILGKRAAVLEWGLPNGSTYFGSGILGGITGRRLDGVVIDDPIRGREDADSETIREKTWEAYKSDIRTRLKPGGFIVMILTRWHEDDPAGRILPDDYDGETGWIMGKDGEHWYVLCLETQCTRADDPLGREIGEYIWPEWFTGNHFETEKNAQGPRNWASLFQQRPTPDEGVFFKEDWFRWYTEKPAHLTLYGASDYAVTEDDGDYTVHGVAGVDPNDDIYLLDLYRKQVDSYDAVEAGLDMMFKWRPMAWIEEKAQIEKAVGPFIETRMRERNREAKRSGQATNYQFRVQLPSAGNKAMKCQSFRGRAAQGKVYLPVNAPWVMDYVAELKKFPNAKHDDQVDFSGLVGRILDKMTAAQKPQKPKASRDLTLDEAIAQDEAYAKGGNRRMAGL